MQILVGTSTHGTDSRGIYCTRLDPATGALSEPALAAPADNPTWLLKTEDGFLTVNEHGDCDGGGQITHFRRDGSAFREVRRLPSHGADPCHLALSGDRLAVANYSGGSVALYEWTARRQIAGLLCVLHPDRTGPHPRQQSPHPHGVYFFGSELQVPDLGGDCIHRYQAATGELRGVIELPPGSGPRHLSPDGRYLVTELHNTLIPIHENGAGIPVSTLPADCTTPSSVAEIQQRPGRIYVSNRGHDSIAVFRTRPTLELLQHRSTEGRHPRHFLLTPDGRYLLVANRDSNNIVSLAVDEGGRLGETLSNAHCPAPMHLLPL